MQSERKIGSAPRTTHLCRDISALTGQCIGCANCQGLCEALIELITLPEFVLLRGQVA